MDTKLMQEFNRDKKVMRLERIYKSSSILEVVGVERTETRHSQFVKWLFALSEINTLSNSSPIMHLLDILVRRAYEQNKQSVIPQEFITSIVTRKAKLEIEEVNTEIPTTGLKLDGKTGKIDILIKLFDKESKRNIYLTIENKIYSSEHDNQTLKYYAYMMDNRQELKTQSVDCEFDEKKYKCPTNPQKDINLFVLLSPTSEYEMTKTNVLEKLSKCSKYIKITYQDIVSDVLSPLVENEEVSQAVKDKINQYVCALEIPSKECNEVGDAANNNIMAASTLTCQFSNDVWDMYNKLIKECILYDEKPCVDFINSHKELLSNLLCVIHQTTLYESVFYLSRFLLLRLEGKTNIFLIKSNNHYLIYDQAGLAKSFATSYCFEKINHPILNVVEAVNILNEAFQSVAPRVGLFNIGEIYKGGRLVSERVDNSANIHFFVNKWGPKYLPKLIELIQKRIINFEIVYP